MRYAAFISYSSLDRASGEAVQKALEAFVLPAPLRGQDFGRGAVPKRIGPVFRDRWDADASADLGAELREALHAADALIVLCSPESAASFWVGEEIREFKRAGRAERIYPVLAAGLPRRYDAQATPQGAFHPALFERWEAAAQGWQPDPREPLAPDLRAEGDGLRFTVLKLVAALTGVPLTTLTQRQAEAERRERNLARWIAGAMALLALGATAGAWSSWRAGNVARQRLESAVEMAARRVDDAAAFQDRYGVPGGVIHELLDGARKDFDELTADAPDAPTLALQRARLDRLFARLYETVGDGAQHQAMAERALAGLASVPTERRWLQPGTWLARLPQAQQVAVERLQALSAQAQAAAARGDAAAAGLALDRMAGEADALRRHADSAPLRSLAAQARAQKARLAYEAGELQPALAGLSDAIRILEGVAAPVPGSGEPVPDADELATLRSEQAEMLLELGRHAEALQVQEAVVASLRLPREPGSLPPDRARSLAMALARRGDMRLAARRDSAGAREDYLAARAMLVDLVAQDSARADWKRDLSLAHERVGDAHLQAGELPAAQAAFEACLGLRRELAARNRAHAEWRRDLTVALERMADVHALQRRPREAEDAYAEALALRQAAHEAAPADAAAARDLAVLWMRLGQARTRAGAPLPEIDASYARAMALMQPLVARAHAESRWRRDLAVAHAERGEARRAAGRAREAQADFQAAMDLVRALRETSPDDAQLAQDEAWLRQRLRR